MVDKILILDFGGQYNQTIARKVRGMGVYSELCSYKISASELKVDPSIKGLIIGSGPCSVFDEEPLLIDKDIFELGLPILGVGYGMQLMAKELGGRVQEHDSNTYDKTSVLLLDDNDLVKGMDTEQLVWMREKDQVTMVPNGFYTMASNMNSPIALMGNPKLKLYGLQFHPEVKQTENGTTIIENFVYRVCQANKNWSMDKFIEQEVNKIQETVKDDEVLCALSGGVDSAVVATLLYRAIGDKLTCIFVDTGLLRLNEADAVENVFRDRFKMNLIKVDAQQIFLSKLKGISEPEKKRKIIGTEFINVFEKESKKLSHIKWLAQGTLYSDVIESGTEFSGTIKSHHNVGGLPEHMDFKLIEPLRSLFKDEVRELGLKLGLPKEIINRQPFPGPGLAIRVLGEVTEHKLKLVRESDAILRDEIQKAGLDKEIWQYFTILPDIKSVGVSKDQRTYDYTIGIRAVTSIDGMSADWARIPYDVLDTISSRIVNEVEGVNRIVYDCTSKPPSTIEWE